MSGGSGGPIIIGGTDLAHVIEQNIEKVAVFRQKRCKDLLAKYRENENSLSDDDNQLLLRCTQDIIDNR